MSISQQSQPTAIPFVYLQNDRFVVSEEAKSFLSQIKTPIAVLTIVGKYRTGKSLFLNRIMLGKSKAFKVSPTINSCTRGLWLWKDTLKFKNEEQQKQVLIIDTEGFGATEQSDAYNNKILLFALLLSSYFVYNSVGSIDENSLNSISVLANLANEIQSKNTKDENIEQNFPSFLWLVRDFTLNLVDKNDIPIQAKEYLEQALQIQKGTSNLIEGKNRIRRMMKHFFRDRDCFTLVRPVETEDMLQQLDTLEEEDFRPTFLDQSRALRQKILMKIKSKKLKNTVLSGETFYELAQNYADVINSNSLPNFQNSYKHLLKLQMCSLKRTLCQQQEPTVKGLMKSAFNSLKSLQDFETLKINYMSEIQSVAKQKIKSHHSLSAFINSEQITLLINEIKTAAVGMLDKCFYTAKQEIRFKYVSAIDHLREDNLMSQPLSTIFSEKELKQFITTLQNNLHEGLKPLKIPEFLSTELSNELFLPFKQQLQDQFNELNARRLHESNHELKIKLEMREENLKDKEEYVRRLENEVKQSQKTAAELEIKLKLTERQLATAKSQATKQATGLSTTIKSLQQQNDCLSNESLQLRKQLQMRNEQIMNLNKCIERRATETSLIDRELSIQKERLDARTEQLEEKKALVERLSQSMVEKTSIIDDLKAKIDELRLSKQALYEQLLSTTQQLSQRLSDSQSLCARQSAQLKSLTTLMHQSSHHHTQETTLLNLQLQKEAAIAINLTETNSHLQQTIVSLEQTLSHFYLKEQAYKQFKKCMKNSSSVQCMHCSRFFMASIFFTHLALCTVFIEKQGVVLESTAREDEDVVSFRVVNVAVNENGSKPVTIYELLCQRGQTKWTLEKKFTDFCQFNQNIQNSLPGIQLSSAKAIFDPKYLSKKSLSLEQKQQLIQKYFNDLSHNTSITTNKFWLEFISYKSANQPTQPTGTKRPALKQIKEGLNYQMHKNQVKDENVKPTQQRRESTHTPQQFFKIWQQKQLRTKASSVSLRRD